jgi:hypothetical protein
LHQPHAGVDIKHNPHNILPGQVVFKTKKRITASFEIGETINPVLVRAALEKMGMVLYFDGEQYRTLEAA